MSDTNNTNADTIRTIIERIDAIFGKQYKVYGPYIRTDGRKHVILYNADKKDKNKASRRTISYPLFLVEILVQSVLHEPNTVDHIDGDFSNNAWDNLRIVHRGTHGRQDAWRAKPIETECVWCGKKFECPPTKIHEYSTRGHAGPFCSKHCSGKYGSSVQNGIIERFDLLPGLPKEEREYYQLEKTGGTVVSTLPDSNLFSEEDILTAVKERNERIDQTYFSTTSSTRTGENKATTTKRAKRTPRQKAEKVCPNCKKKFKSQRREQKYCSSTCYHTHTKGKDNLKARKVVNRPSKEELAEMVWKMPTVKIAAKYGVSDKAVSKWCKHYGINKPTRGYWVKIKSVDKM